MVETTTGIPTIYQSKVSIVVPIRICQSLSWENLAKTSTNVGKIKKLNSIFKVHTDVNTNGNYCIILLVIGYLYYYSFPVFEIFH
jgi:hypothetical protein